MIDVIFPKRAPTVRERETRPVPSDYQPRQLRAVGSNGVEGDGYLGDEPSGVLDGMVDLDRLEDQLNRNRLNEIATLVRSLTYGEMIEFARAIWDIRPEGSIDQNSLPTMLHLWSISGEVSSSRPSYGKTIEQ